MGEVPKSLKRVEILIREEVESSSRKPSPITDQVGGIANDLGDLPKCSRRLSYTPKMDVKVGVVSMVKKAHRVKKIKAKIKQKLENKKMKIKRKFTEY